MTTATPLLYKDIDSILNILEKPEYNATSEVQELLAIYHTTKEKNDQFKAVGEVKKYPLIILEGLDGSGKSTVGKKFAKKINAIKWQTPPESISHLRAILDDSSLLRTAFYSLGNYIAGMEVELLLQRQPVIMDRYWHSTAAFAIAQAVHDYQDKYKMPLKGDPIYEWPKDLFKPDLILLLDVNEKVRLQRLSRRTAFSAQEELLKSCPEFRNNVILAYQNMVNPAVGFVNGNFTFKTVLEDISSRVKPFL